MNEYYGIATTPTDDYLAHYGVLGMKWGIRRQKRIQKRKQNRLEKRIDRFSENENVGTWNGAEKFKHDGYMSAVPQNKKSARHQLFMKIAEEYSKGLGNSYDGSPRSQKVWKKLNQKYKQDYLKAVLTDAKIPINQHTLNTAHRIISAKDGSYTQYDNKHKR